MPETTKWFLVVLGYCGFQVKTNKQTSKQANKQTKKTIFLLIPWATLLDFFVYEYTFNFKHFSSIKNTFHRSISPFNRSFLPNTITISNWTFLIYWLTNEINVHIAINVLSK